MHRVHLAWDGDPSRLARPAFRYALLDRVARAATRRAGQLVAFGLGPEDVRLVIDATPAGAERIVHAVVSGTSRTDAAQRARLHWYERDITMVDRGGTLDAIAWAHAAAGDTPLASPWTSHRDWVGLRRAPFFDRHAVPGISPSAVHAASGGGTLPLAATPWTPQAPSVAPMRLLRVAGAVRGRLPSDRRCFRLYAHLARSVGRDVHHTARSLCLTRRRINQLLAEPERDLRIAHAHLADPRLAAIP